MAQCSTATPPPRFVRRFSASRRLASCCAQRAPSARNSTTPSARSISSGPSFHGSSAFAVITSTPFTSLRHFSRTFGPATYSCDFGGWPSGPWPTSSSFFGASAANRADAVSSDAATEKANLCGLMADTSRRGRKLVRLYRGGNTPETGLDGSARHAIVRAPRLRGSGPYLLSRSWREKAHAQAVGWAGTGVRARVHPRRVRHRRPPQTAQAAGVLRPAADLCHALQRAAQLPAQVPDGRPRQQKPRPVHPH